MTVPPEDGYGEHDARGIQEVDRTAFPPDFQPEPGMELTAEGEGGEPVPFVIREVEGDKIVIDLNHPLAGKTLHFDITVREVREATAEERGARARARAARPRSLQRHAIGRRDVLLLRASLVAGGRHVVRPRLAAHERELLHHPRLPEPDLPPVSTDVDLTPHVALADPPPVEEDLRLLGGVLSARNPWIPPDGAAAAACGRLPLSRPRPLRGRGSAPSPVRLRLGRETSSAGLARDSGLGGRSLARRLVSTGRRGLSLRDLVAAEIGQELPRVAAKPAPKPMSAHAAAIVSGARSAERPGWARGTPRAAVGRAGGRRGACIACAVHHRQRLRRRRRRGSVRRARMMIGSARTTARSEGARTG